MDKPHERTTVLQLIYVLHLDKFLEVKSTEVVWSDGRGGPLAFVVYGYHRSFRDG